MRIRRLPAVLLLASAAFTLGFFGWQYFAGKEAGSKSGGQGKHTAVEVDKGGSWFDEYKILAFAQSNLYIKNNHIWVDAVLGEAGSTLKGRFVLGEPGKIDTFARVSAKDGKREVLWKAGDYNALKAMVGKGTKLLLFVKDFKGYGMSAYLANGRCATSGGGCEYLRRVYADYGKNVSLVRMLAENRLPEYHIRTSISKPPVPVLRFGIFTENE